MNDKVCREDNIHSFTKRFATSRKNEWIEASPGMLLWGPVCKVTAPVAPERLPVADLDMLEALLTCVELVRDRDRHIKDASIADRLVRGDFNAPDTFLIDAPIGSAVVDAAPRLFLVGGVHEQHDSIKG